MSPNPELPRLIVVNVHASHFSDPYSLAEVAKFSALYGAPLAEFSVRFILFRPKDVQQWEWERTPQSFRHVTGFMSDSIPELNEENARVDINFYTTQS